MSNLTFEKLDDIRRDLERAAPRGLVTPFMNRFGGMKIIEAPPAPQKIAVRDIKHADGTSILAPEFRREMDAWLAGRFGYADYVFKDQFFIMGDTIIGSIANIRVLKRHFGP